MREGFYCISIFHENNVAFCLCFSGKDDYRIKYDVLLKDHNELKEKVRFDITKKGSAVFKLLGEAVYCKGLSSFLVKMS